MPWPYYDKLWGKDSAQKKNVIRKVLIHVDYTQPNQQAIVVIKQKPSELVSNFPPSPVQSRDNVRRKHDRVEEGTPQRRNLKLPDNVKKADHEQLLLPVLVSPNIDKKGLKVHPRNPAVGQRLSLGSESELYSDNQDDESFADDDSMVSSRDGGRDYYDWVTLSISPSGGFMSLHYSDSNDDIGIYQPSADGEDKEHSTENRQIVEDEYSSLNLVEITPPQLNREASVSFELLSTKIQSHKEQMEKMRSQIRIECLKVATESYKKAKLDVPDFLLAEMNAEYNSLVQRKFKVKAHETSNGSHISSHDAETNGGTKLQSENGPKPNPSARHVTLKLSKDDEIHALPCQCALNIVGVRGFGLFSPQNFNEDESEFGRHFFGIDISSEVNETVTKNLVSSIPDHSSDNYSSQMVRTSSAYVPTESIANTNRQEIRKSFKASDGESNGTTVVEAMRHEDSGYHEITLIRRRDKTNDSICQETNTEHEYTLWNAITIRCADHDEMDAVIRDLKCSARDATIVPFSPNPKARLSKKRWRPVDAKRNYVPGEVPKDTFHTLSDDAISSPHSHQTNVTASSVNNIHTKTAWNLKFNNNHYCELCGLNFTLLSRRHHCRKCDRSCCGDCSSIVLVCGGDGRRFCNRCSADILRKQSQALQRQSGTLRRLSSFALPGKVHPSCGRLGVGVMGKLPHWKYYLHLNPSRRPAVGRVTVEVVEAFALPIYDMMKGKVDPYVRATITGYDRDMLWTLREWMPSNRFSLCSGYCSATLSPQWRGPGRKGGELLTLPVICTAGAVLRLEVLHYNSLTHTRGKDIILGFVEIPLSDFLNANLRRPEDFSLDVKGQQKKKLYHDGYSDRWYRLLTTDDVPTNSIMLSKPVPNPFVTNNDSTGADKKLPMERVKESLDEIWKRTVGSFITPVEWFASFIKLDLPARKPEAICEQHKSKAILHVRIKLNASEFGDLMSHVWFPPVQRYPSIPPFNPQVLWSRITQVIQLTEPYRNIFKFLEEVLKWKREPLVCVRCYCVFAIHVFLLAHVLPLLHFYLIIFLGMRMRAAHKNNVTENKQDPFISRESIHFTEEADRKGNLGEAITTAKDSKMPLSPSIEFINQNCVKEGPFQGVNSVTTDYASSHVCEEEEAARLHFAVNWVAKRFLDNKGLEIMQFKLGCLSRDVRNITMVWDGSKPGWTKAAMVIISLSLFLHFCIDRRILWLVGTFTWYFAQSPITILFARMCLGFWRGLAKVTRRREIYCTELVDLSNHKFFKE